MNRRDTLLRVLDAIRAEESSTKLGDSSRALVTARVILNEVKDLTYLLAITQAGLRDHRTTCEVPHLRSG